MLVVMVVVSILCRPGSSMSRQEAAKQEIASLNQPRALKGEATCKAEVDEEVRRGHQPEEGEHEAKEGDNDQDGVDENVDLGPPCCVEIEQGTLDGEGKRKEELASVGREVDTHDQEVYYAREKEPAVHGDVVQLALVTNLSVFIIDPVQSPYHLVFFPVPTGVTTVCMLYFYVATCTIEQSLYVARHQLLC